MKLDDIKLGVSPLTERIYIGTVSKRDAGLWTQKRDATSDFCRALLEWCGPDTVREIHSSSGDHFEVTIRRLPGLEHLKRLDTVTPTQEPT